MKLNEIEAAIYNQTVEALRQVNDGLKRLREMQISCRLVESEGRWFLDAKAIVTTDSLTK